MRKPRKKPPVWQPPLAVERAYRAELTRYAREIAQGVTDELLPELERLLDEAYRYRPDSLLDVENEGGGWSAALLLILQRLLRRLFGRRVDVSQYANAASDFNKRQFHKMLRKAYSVDVFKAEPWLNAELSAWETRNLSLIKSIPDQYVERLQGEIVRAVRAGQTTKQVTALVKSTYDLPVKRAELIATDQIGKLNGQLTQLRQQAIGIKSYRWQTVLDSRVRPDHVEREGDVFKWSDPPPDGHPGEPIRCRCWAAAQLPELEDLDLS